MENFKPLLVNSLDQDTREHGGGAINNPVSLARKRFNVATETQSLKKSQVAPYGRKNWKSNFRECI